VVEGWITPQRARELYRVAIRADLSLDGAKTADLRRSRA
jgi:N-methylhydantoinase B